MSCQDTGDVHTFALCFTAVIFSGTIMHHMITLDMSIMQFTKRKRKYIEKLYRYFGVEKAQGKVVLLAAVNFPFEMYIFNAKYNSDISGDNL